MSAYYAFVLNNNYALLGRLMFVSIYNCQLLQELYSQNWSVLFLEYDLPPLKRPNLMWATVETVRLCGYEGNPGHSTLGLGLCYYYFYTLGR